MLPPANAEGARTAAKRGLNPSSSGPLPHTEGLIRLGTPADLTAASTVYHRASLSNASDRSNLLAHPEYLILGPEELAEAAPMSRNRTARWSALPPGPRSPARWNWKTRRSEVTTALAANDLAFPARTARSYQIT